MLTWIKRKWRAEPLFSTGAALLVMVLLQTYALGFRFETFGDWFNTWLTNWLNILRNNAIVGMIALGMTFVILTGGIDLAVGSTLVGAGTLLMMCIDTGGGGWLASLGITGVPAYMLGIAVTLLAGLSLGSLIGVAVTKGRVPPFIVTLGAMNIIRSVTQHFMQAYTPRVPLEFTKLANQVILGQRFLPIVYWFVMAAVLAVVARHTAFGRHVYAVGSNEKTTRLSGINVDWVKFKVYALMGFIVSVAATLQVARIGSMDTASAGSGYELEAIAAVIVGGTSMSGGKGSVVGTVLGMLIIGVMNNLLNLLGVPSFLRNAFKGAIVVAAVLMQRKEREA